MCYSYGGPQFSLNFYEITYVFWSKTLCVWLDSCSERVNLIHNNLPHLCVIREQLLSRILQSWTHENINNLSFIKYGLLREEFHLKKVGHHSGEEFLTTFKHRHSLSNSLKYSFTWKSANEVATSRERPRYDCRENTSVFHESTADYTLKVRTAMKVNDLWLYCANFGELCSNSAYTAY